MVKKIVLVVVAAGLVVSCREPGAFSDLRREFVYESLALSPALATQAGLHHHGDLALAEMLDEFSEEALEGQLRFYRDFRRRLERAVKAEALPPEERADYDMIQDRISLQLLEREEIGSHRRRPTLYVERIGAALFAPFTLEYAPKVDRFRDIIARIEKIPTLLEQAKQNLVESPEIWTKVAIDQNQGNIRLIDETLRAEVPEELRESYERAAAPALAALRGFSDYLQQDLMHRTGDWRLGQELYARKFRYALGTDLTPEEVLAAAEEDLTRIRREMFKLSVPLHHKYYPTHRCPVDLNHIVGETLDYIAERHATPETYLAEARRDLDEARQFVQKSGLMALPPRDNLEVIETPEFMRGIYAVGGFAPAPPLQPHLGAFYWLTPIPKEWPKERIKSKLREYNVYGLKLLTIHEAMPGHYVQFEYANDIEPVERRVLRTFFGNGPYVEGWAMYATEVMLDEGYLDGNPALRLTYQKQQLRMLANAILDVRLHTMGMTDEEAMDLMVNRTFQEQEEATAKLRRAKLSSCQLPTYYVGWRDWHRLRERYREHAGERFRLAEFHERALRAGAVPLPVLSRMLMGQAPGG